MEPEPSVQIREACEPCGGSGERKVQAGTGHVRWGKRVACPDCDGTGHQARWIPLSELKALLER
jgi:DnaJ-class molecular chaperone